MGFTSCFSGATFQTLKLASISYSSSSSSLSFFRPLCEALISSHSHSRSRTSSLPLLFVRALSALATLQSVPVSSTDDDKGVVVKPQWKAAIDFKWIRDNRDAVAVNIKNRNSNVNLDLVLDLYDKLLSLQKHGIVTNHCVQKIY
ncbi:hypothetical protein RJ641_029722 [Dillenia turbinata]|uniref:Uncharacterized protein n=1 Tax=Dillenia turbinata TaxID=194707 RepID=A0AAN8W1X3_9MAGN